MTGIEQKIINVLKTEDKPLRPGDIASAANEDKDDVSKAIKSLKAAGKIHSPKRCFYALSE